MAREFEFCHSNSACGTANQQLNTSRVEHTQVPPKCMSQIWCDLIASLYPGSGSSVFSYFVAHVRTRAMVVGRGQSNT